MPRVGNRADARSRPLSGSERSAIAAAVKRATSQLGRRASLRVRGGVVEVFCDGASPTGRVVVEPEEPISARDLAAAVRDGWRAHQTAVTWRRRTRLVRKYSQLEPAKAARAEGQR